jgi:hypothetical protein
VRDEEHRRCVTRATLRRALFLHPFSLFRVRPRSDRGSARALLFAPNGAFRPEGPTNVATGAASEASQPVESVCERTAPWADESYRALRLSACLQPRRARQRRETEPILFGQAASSIRVHLRSSAASSLPLPSLRPSAHSAPLSSCLPIRASITIHARPLPAPPPIPDTRLPTSPIPLTSPASPTSAA